MGRFVSVAALGRAPIPLAVGRWPAGRFEQFAPAAAAAKRAPASARRALELAQAAPSRRVFRRPDAPTRTIARVC